MRITKVKRILGVAAALVAGVASASPAAQAAYPGRSGLIAYVEQYDDCGHYRVAAQVHTADCGPPQPPGVYTMTPTGSQRNRRLGGFDPTFSPDGRTLAAAHPTRRGARVYGVNVYGPRRPRRLTAEDATRAYDESEPTWSPSGGRLAFTRRYRGRDANGQVTYDVPAIYLARAGATRATRLEDGMQAAWSTRDRIAYVGFSADSEEPDGIYVMRADGTHVRQLTYGEETSPQWSPDGRYIAFASNGHVFVMKGDGSYLRRVTNSGNSDSGPAWSPDGANIVFDRTDSWLATEEIDSVSVHTGRLHRVRKTYDDDLFYFAPDWQPLPR